MWWTRSRSKEKRRGEGNFAALVLIGIRSPTVREGSLTLEFPRQPLLTRGLLTQGLRACFPARHVLDLFRGQRIDRHTQRAQLQTGDLLIDFLRQQVHAGLELAFILYQILDRKRLIGKA